MITIQDINSTNFDSIPDDAFWSIADEKELKMHRIHAYPAKFPALIPTKGLEFAQRNGLVVKRVADIFCGCGTVAFEAKRSGIDFWGCDINPVATMIAKTKSGDYKVETLEDYYDKIEKYFLTHQGRTSYKNANERLKYWYDEDTYKETARLKNAIIAVVPETSRYHLFFMCAFSNILKAASRWLTKSIKPQVDPDKKLVDIITTFEEQCSFMIKAYKESNVSGMPETKIVNANFLSPQLNRPQVDMIITSPPYVTSYEYADLHQLSSLWLGFATDYRDLRDGSIGSSHHDYDFKREVKRLNDTGTKIVFGLMNYDKSKAHDVAKYFLDMQKVALGCYQMLSDNGMALFVIGNTEYKGVRIDNAKHLSESLINGGFKKVLVTKRKITKKILTPYRNPQGRFSRDKNSRKVYGEEFIVIGRK